MLNRRCCRKLIGVCIAWCLCISGNGQAEWSADSVLTKQQMWDDLDSLRKTIIDSHPNPFAFYSSVEFENNFQEIKNSIDTAATLRSFTDLVSNLVLPMRDSHTTLDFFSLHRMCFVNDNYFLPINIYNSNDSIFIESDWEDFLPKGSRLISVNGISSIEIYKQSLGYSCIEGDADDGQLRIADAIFPVVLAWNYKVLLENELQVIAFGEETEDTFIVKGYQKKEYKKISKLRSKRDSHQAVSLKILEGDSIAVLRVATFAPAERNKYKRDIRKSFRKLSKMDCKNLVLDIRDNSGGSSAWVEYLYSFLDKGGYNTPSNVIGKNSKLALQRSRLFNNGLSKLILRIFYKNDEDVQSFNRFARLPMGAIDTSYFLKPTIQKSNIVYKNKCILLINGLTASAGVDFTNQFKRKSRGLIIGEPCLGPVSGTFGNPVSFLMANSKLRVNIATIRYNYDNSFTYSRAAIAPDVFINTTGSNLFHNEDPALVYILSNSSFSK